ncbi:dihydropteroate synthase [Chloroflexota bacterium]
MLVIGEKINASSRSVATAITTRDREFVEGLARAQAAAGADFIDVNAGIGHENQQHEAAAMEWLVEVVQAATGKPLVIDTDAADVVEAALRKYKGERVIVNSVTAEPEKLAAIGPLAAGRQAWLVALAMGSEGIPDTVEKRLAACELIITHLTRLGMQAEQVFFDPLVLPLAVDSSQGLVTLRTLEQIKNRYPSVRTVMGLSNISYGLPNRKLINRTFLSMAVYAGLDAVILDPFDDKAMNLIKVADMLAGKDPLCRSYIRAHRKGTIVD